MAFFQGSQLGALEMTLAPPVQCLFGLSHASVGPDSSGFRVLVLGFRCALCNCHCN